MRRWRVGAWGATALLGVLVVSGGLALLPGHRLHDPGDFSATIQVSGAKAYASCPPRLHSSESRPVTVMTPQGGTEVSVSGTLQPVSSKQLIEKAECVFRHHQIDATTLRRVRRFYTASASQIVPWWAPTSIDPTTAVVTVWAVLLALWIGGFAILVRGTSRANPPSPTQRSGCSYEDWSSRT
jgi:hypothetical protein